MNTNWHWRFARSNFGKQKGLNTGDAETFKKNPFWNFGREIIQNSLDARYSDEAPVVVEFSLFKMNVKNIPDLDGLKEAVRLCMEYWRESQPSFYEKYEEILQLLNGKTLECLRISDFNTTGLVGISRPNNNVKNKYMSLIKSTGVSDKNSEMAGGSKGVGKNAAFLLSKIKTLFYSTCTCEGEIGYSGVADFISGYVKGDSSGERDYTQGDGYYGQNDKNAPICELLNLDNSYPGRRKEKGTDIFILGLNKEDEWSIEILNSVLESFMVSILKNDLIVRIQGEEISRDTVEELVFNKTYVKAKKLPYLISQINILKKTDDVQIFDIDTDYGPAQLLVLVCEDDNKANATHKCVMVRYPYMKIFDLNLPKNLNVSAMCLIENNKLGKELREIENPQHNAWEPKRLEPSKRKTMEDIIENIKTQINDIVLSCFKSSMHDVIDPYGAGEFLADINGAKGKNNSEHSANTSIDETVKLSELKPVTFIENNANIDQEDGEGVLPDVGASDDNGDDVLHPNGHNSGGGGGYTPGENVSGSKDGDGIIMKKGPIASTRYTIMAINKNSGRYRILFIAPDNYDECYLCIKRIEDELSNKSNVAIFDMVCNGVEIRSENNFEYGPFSIKAGTKVRIDITTDQTEYFASEVKIYASEK